MLRGSGPRRITMANSIFIIGSILVCSIPLASCSDCTLTNSSSIVKADCYARVLNTIPDGIPSIVTHVNMSRNIIENISSSDFSRFTHLQLLDLSYNYLSDGSMSADSFSSLQSLKTLILTGNRWEWLSSHFLVNCTVEVLHLSNSLGSLGTRLSGVKSVERDFLVNLPNLKELYLDRNQIETIDPLAFASITRFPALTILDLSSNHLETLDQLVRPFVFNADLLEFRVHDNWWICDCNLRWLRMTLNSSSARWSFDGRRRTPVCEEPLRLKHQAWDTIPAERFGCAPKLLKSPDTAYAEIGSTFYLEVLITTHTSPALINWIQNGQTLEYKTRLSAEQFFNGSLLHSRLTVSDFSKEDYGAYKCYVSTTFGSTVKVIDVSTPPPDRAAYVDSLPLILAVSVCSVVFVIILVVVILICLKSRLTYRGKWNMGAGSSGKSTPTASQPDCYVAADDVTAETPLTTDGFDGMGLPKNYSEEEILALPVETEYPADDAGCSAYNEYLESVSANRTAPSLNSANHNSVHLNSPNHSSLSSPNTTTESGLVGPPPLVSPNGLVPYDDMSHYIPVHSMSPHKVSASVIMPHGASPLNTSSSGSPLTFIPEEGEVL